MQSLGYCPDDGSFACTSATGDKESRHYVFASISSRYQTSKILASVNKLLLRVQDELPYTMFIALLQDVIDAG